MKKEVGLWINLSRAVIVTINGEAVSNLQVRSNIEKYVQFSGGSKKNPLYGTHTLSGEGKNDPNLARCIETYFDAVASLLRHADSIWIFGPGNAKNELKKRLHRDSLEADVVSGEFESKMTDRQIVAQVRQHYHSFADI